jgi:hypothetical protein
MAVAGPGGAVRTVTVPLLQQGPYRDTPAGLAAARTTRGLSRQIYVKANAASCRTGQAEAPSGT